MKNLVFNNRTLLFDTPKKIINYRSNFIYGFVGQNDTGKSVVASQKALKWKQSKPSHYKIVAHDRQNRFPFAHTNINAGDNDCFKRLEGWTDYLLILDDFRAINKNPIALAGLDIILIDRIKNNVDIMFICHNPAAVINTLTDYATHWFIFKMNSKEVSFKNKMNNYTYCLAASIEVNNYVQRFGKGTYPVFPYVYVDCGKERLKGINMTQDLSQALIMNP
jgi:hypothetical protein